MGNNNGSDIEFPDPSQKLATKFILDSLKKKQIAFSEESLEVEEPQPSPVAKTPVKKKSKVLQELSFSGDRKYFRIGESAELLGVEPYVLRYWESEFPGIRPMKSKSGHRTYSRADLKLFSQIRHLLYVEKYSVKGARKRLNEMKKEQKAAPNRQQANDHKKVLKNLSLELKGLIELASQDPGA